MIIQTLGLASIRGRAWAILILFAVGLIGNTILGAVNTRDAMHENYQRGVKNLVTSGLNIVTHFHGKFLAGEMTEDEAKQRAIDAVQGMKYDNGNYVFMAGPDGTQFAGLERLIGKNIMPVKDAEGFEFVKELYKVAKQGGGYVHYKWNTSDPSVFEPKTSYATQFQPWGWMIGSGINMEALAADIQKAELTLAGNTVVILGLLAVIVAYFIKTITSPLKKTVTAMKELSQGEGDLTQRLEEVGTSETVYLARYFNQFLSSIQQIMLGISDAGNQVSSASNQLTTSVHEIDRNLNQQQNDVDQLATAMTEMLATVEEVAGRTVEANDASKQAATETSGSRAIMQQNVQGADELAAEIEQTSGIVEKLASDARNVDTVLEVIRGVAEQTNLLALNAAIEAARAGEQGRGFAVVADEVRTLSQRTQESTLEIQNIVEKLQLGAEEVVKVMERSSDKATNASTLSTNAGEALDRINNEVQTIEEMNQHIAAAAEEQTVTVNDINRNVVSMRDMSVSVAEESSQMASASVELTKVSEGLMTTINRFKLA